MTHKPPSEAIGERISRSKPPGLTLARAEIPGYTRPFKPFLHANSKNRHMFLPSQKCGFRRCVYAVFGEILLSGRLLQDSWKSEIEIDDSRPKTSVFPANLDKSTDLARGEMNSFLG
jgi:hypothetical protein